MRRALCVAMLLLAACRTKPAANEGNAAENQPAAIGEDNQSAPAASGTKETQDVPASQAGAGNELGTLPPADAALRFVGNWAKDQASCASKRWTFTAKALAVRGGPNCSFYEVTKVPGGYDVAAQCPKKQPVHTDLIKLRFAESARAMLVESNAISPTGLIYCGK